MRIKNKKKVTRQILSEDDVKYIKYLLNQCEYTDTGLGKMWGVSRSEIYNIKTNRRWWDIEPMEYANC